MEKLDYVLDFCVNLGKKMIADGANLERVDTQIERILASYDLKDVSLVSLTTRLYVSARDEQGRFADRQSAVPPQVFNLERLKKYNALAHKVILEAPDPESLQGLLDEVHSNDFSWWILLLGYLVAMAALARMFSATWPEILIAELHTLMLFGLSKLYGKVHINKILTNFISMFLCSVSAMLWYRWGVIGNFYAVAITNAFFLIPGVQMVNCARNILCGHESNGIIELLKILLEVTTIVAGVAAGYAALGSFIQLPALELSLGATSMTWASGCELAVLTMLASGGFSVVFNIHWKDLPFAILGGALVRVAFILFQLALPNNRFVYTLLAAFCAALYSEILGNARKEPATLYLYPAIVPLIPGDLFYYTALGLVWSNKEMMTSFGPELAYSLLGISVGFVICSTAVHYVRKIAFIRHMTA